MVRARAITRVIKRMNGDVRVVRSRGGGAVGGAPRKHGFPRVDVRLGERLHARGGFSERGVDDSFELGVHARELVRHAGFDVVVLFLGVFDGGFGETDVAL